MDVYRAAIWISVTEHGLERFDPTGVATHLGATLGPDVSP